jgi:hypothetical protein
MKVNKKKKKNKKREGVGRRREEEEYRDSRIRTEMAKLFYAECKF